MSERKIVLTLIWTENCTCPSCLRARKLVDFMKELGFAFTKKDF